MKADYDGPLEGTSELYNALKGISKDWSIFSTTERNDFCLLFSLYCRELRIKYRVFKCRAGEVMREKYIDCKNHTTKWLASVAQSLGFLARSCRRV